MAATWKEILVSSRTMRAYVAAPEGDGRHPAVVVIQHAGGVDEFVRQMTDRFAGEGFVAVAPDLYHRDDPNTSDDPLTRMGRLRDANIIADSNAAIAYASTHPASTGAVGITGFCMGGRVAYLMAAQNDSLKASVVFYGGNTMVAWGEGTPPFEQTASIGCPVMGLFGADDPNPNPADVAKIEAELRKHGKKHEFHSYAGAGHAFMNEGRPSYREEAAGDAWEKCVRWFRMHLT
jgi:carboxymethylenebutenolidase